MIQMIFFNTKIDTIIKSLNLSTEQYNYFHEFDINSIKENLSYFLALWKMINLDFSIIAEQKKIHCESIYLLGYCSHVKNELMVTASKSGFDEVMPRSKFVKILPEFLNNFDILDK